MVVVLTLANIPEKETYNHQESRLFYRQEHLDLLGCLNLEQNRKLDENTKNKRTVGKSKHFKTPFPLCKFQGVGDLYVDSLSQKAETWQKYSVYQYKPVCQI